jgi:glycerol kinase
VVASSGICADVMVDGAHIPLAGIAGDQQAALFGQACHAPGMAKNTYGTGCFLLMNTGHDAVASTQNLLTTVAWQLDGGVERGARGVRDGVGGVRDGVGGVRDGVGGVHDGAGGVRDGVGGVRDGACGVRDGAGGVRDGGDGVRAGASGVRADGDGGARSGALEYALEGSVFIGGAVVQWLRDGLKIVRSASEIEALAASVTDNGGVYFVPAFTGLGAPHWDAYARGAISGLTRGSTSAHIARAALESIAYQSADLLRAMQQDAGITLTELRVDGGATANNLLMQFQSDLLGVPVVRPRVAETTALGAAYLAGLAVGFWKDIAEVAANWQVDRRFEPSMPRAQVDERVAGWNRAVARAKSI